MSGGADVKSYHELRKATAARDRGLREKVMSLEEAASLVNDGDHVAIGGCTMSRTPIAMIWALIRAARKHLKVSRSIVSTEGDLLFASGAANHIMTSWFSQGIVWGVSKVMRHYTEQKLARFEEWSHMSMGLRYRAGAMGVPFMATRAMIGSDVGREVADQVKPMTCPFTGEPLLLLPALNPEVALIHVQRADRYGNAQIDGLQFMDIDIAMAANRVILTTERLISNDQIRRAPDRTRIPFFTVDAVVEVPYGAAPHECYGLYEPFFGHLDYYAGLTAKDTAASAKRYLDEYYRAPASWSDYLAKIGMDAVLDASRRGRSIFND
jgi:glutaconate CoA-transferase subunit A